MSERLKIFLISCAIGAGIYFGAYFLIPRHYVPPEFSEARISGAELASQIASSSSDSLVTLQKIAEFDRKGQKSEALTLVAQAVLKNRDTQQAALQLSGKLESMARSLDSIEPSKARVLATEAVSSEVALVSHLLVYSDNLSQLFQLLSSKFSGTAQGTDGKVQDLVKKLNDEAAQINTFNTNFSQSLAEFDKLF